MRATRGSDILPVQRGRGHGVGAGLLFVMISLSGSLHAEEPPTVTTPPPVSAPTSTALPHAGAEASGRILALPPAVIDEMKRSTWRPGCPVPLQDLRLVQTPYVSFAGDTQTGEIVVHATIAEATLAAFEELFAAGFPIERMERIERYNGSDDESMRANNTSAFNCRKVTGGRGYSKHAYGVAIDINPLINPYVKRRKSGIVVEPESGRPYIKRDASVPGLIIKGDVAHRAFTSRGFTWGGTWRSVQDYQHFETARPRRTKAKKTR